jgi:ectoine hydroxylase-related dioxygenase (phytanoyl-CoA dioxygenase family)
VSGLILDLFLERKEGNPSFPHGKLIASGMSSTADVCSDRNREFRKSFFLDSSSIIVLANVVNRSAIFFFFSFFPLWGGGNFEKPGCISDAL